MGKRNYNRGHPGKWINIGDLYPFEVPAATRRALRQERDRRDSEDLDAGLLARGLDFEDLLAILDPRGEA